MRGGDITKTHAFLMRFSQNLLNCFVIKKLTLKLLMSREGITIEIRDHFDRMTIKKLCMRTCEMPKPKPKT